MSPDNNAAIEFLYWLRPNGPWAVTAVQLDKKGIETRTFRPETERDLREWLQRYNGQRNIYFALNPPMRDIDKKAEREEIAAVTHLHVDVDPRAGEDLEGERARILSLLTERRPHGVPEPSAIIFSGGGYQGIWTLAEPIPIEGDLAAAEDAKRYNVQLETLFGGDNCHNIDRILRLPGTINIPDARKLKKGRVATLASIVEVHAERVYNLRQFTAAPAVQARAVAGFGSGETVKVSGNVQRLGDVSELDQWDVPDRVRVVIVQGRHPDEPKQGDNSRSAWVFDCVCNLVRCEVPDDVIFSILMDPDFGISESVLEMKSNAAKYAVRQIERAKENAIDPVLREFNERYAVIGNMGGKCRVVEEQMDEALKRTRLTAQSFEDLRNRHMHQYVVIGKDKAGLPIRVPAGKWWLAHEQRRQFDRLIFLPGQEVRGAYNLWKGFGVEAIPGLGYERYLDHVLRNICAGVQDHFDYLVRWMARVVQQPATAGEVAVVLRGSRGVGKSFFAKEFGKLLGRHFLQVSNSVHLVGQFNKHLRDVVLLFADEAFFAGDKRHESVLKTLITEETLNIEAKGIDMESSPNYIHLIMASNDDHVVPAGGDERRFLMLDVGDAQQLATNYFKEIKDELDNGGREALLHYLLNLDLGGWDVRVVPRTAALAEQQQRTLGQEAEWWYNKLVEGRILDEDDEWQTEILKEEVLGDYLDTARRLNYTRRGNATTLGLFLHKYCPGLTSVQRMAKVERMLADGYVQKVERRAYFYVLPTLEEARATWERLHGSISWPPTQAKLAKQDEKPF